MPKAMHCHKAAASSFVAFEYGAHADRGAMRGRWLLGAATANVLVAQTVHRLQWNHLSGFRSSAAFF